MISSEAEADALARTRRSSSRWLGFALFVWGVVMYLVCSSLIGPKLFLIYHYGWARVQRDGLSVVELTMAPPSRWIISNGDRIRVWDYQHEIFSLVAWAAILAITVPPTWLLFRWTTGEARRAGSRRRALVELRPADNQTLQRTGRASRSSWF